MSRGKELDNNGMGVVLMQEGHEFVVYNILGRELIRTPHKKQAVDLLDYYKRKAHPILGDHKKYIGTSNCGQLTFWRS